MLSAPSFLIRTSNLSSDLRGEFAHASSIVLGLCHISPRVTITDGGNGTVDPGTPPGWFGDRPACQRTDRRYLRRYPPSPVFRLGPLGSLFRRSRHPVRIRLAPL